MIDATFLTDMLPELPQRYTYKAEILLDEALPALVVTVIHRQTGTELYQTGFEYEFLPLLHAYSSGNIDPSDHVVLQDLYGNETKTFTGQELIDSFKEGLGQTAKAISSITTITTGLGLVKNDPPMPSITLNY